MLSVTTDNDLYPSAQQPSAGIMGFGYDYPMAQQASAGMMGFGQPFESSKAVVLGGSLLGGALTTLLFAGAFHLAKTERKWWPAILIGGVTTLVGLTELAIR